MGRLSFFDEPLLGLLDELRVPAERLAREIWEHPEIGLGEKHAARIYAEALSGEGFEVRRGVGPLETAVVGSWGEGKPVIGFLGEYDALPGLSQKVASVREPILEGAAGHGCGHNLLGAGSLASAVAVKRLLKARGMAGTVRFYGCPAEENAGGKAYMAREGVFDDLDAALCWHPWNSNEIWANRTNAVVAADFHFHGGRASGPADRIRWPLDSRDAREAAVLMETGIRYLQGHLPTGMRLYSALRGGEGGPFDTVVKAALRVALSGPDGEVVREGYRRIAECARGAVLMSGTRMEAEFLSGMREYRPNRTLSLLMEKKLRRVGAPEFDAHDLRFAEELRGTLVPVETAGAGSLCGEILERNDAHGVDAGFTDVGDVSLIVPTAQIVTACCPLGILPHTWQATASFGSSIGLKGMFAASKVMALTAGELLENERHLGQARKEFEETAKGLCRLLLPEDQEPQGLFPQDQKALRSFGAFTGPQKNSKL